MQNRRHLKKQNKKTKIRDKGMTVRLGWTNCYIFISYLYGSQAWVDWLPYTRLLMVRQQGLGGLTAIHLSLICMTVRLGWTDYHTFVSYLYGSKAWVDCLPKKRLLLVRHQGLGGLTVIHLSLICMTVKLGWTDCHIILLFSGFSNVSQFFLTCRSETWLNCSFMWWDSFVQSTSI